MKTTGVCPKCTGKKLGHFSTVLDTTKGGGPLVVRSLWRQFVKSGDGFFDPLVEVAAKVEAYVCTECGYFEEYVVNPAQVAWEKLDAFAWHTVPAKEPYR